ncbi:alpha-mannosidase 2-like isoform X2 [Oratosquilla oratoria]|uniref:alpha-mannosidase 2-like isoform X2 n=1 Tax=Oratosquilla oratoria TaxID=337810 RepID=UPI003F76F4E7
MRLRMSSMVFAGTLLLATMILLHQLINLPTDQQHMSHQERKEMGVLEMRLKRLEQDLQYNQKAIGEIKSLVRQLTDSANNINDGANTVLEKSDKVFPNKFDRKTVEGGGKDEGNQHGDGVHTVGKVLYNTTSVAKIQQDDCIFSQTSPMPADIQMQNVYDLLPFDNPDGGAWKQGWDITYDAKQWTPDNKLKVFVIPHSHNDPGWIKTYERYFEEQTKFILDRMVEKLSVDNKRKFIWAEVSYLYLWWETISEETKTAVKRLLDRGQLEIVTGGWVMNDEASSHYFAMLEQMVEGHEWLKNNLEAKPNNGWAIDPFGMSSTMAYLLKRMGFENMLIQRVHYSIKKHFAKEKSLEFKWRQIWDTGSTTDMFCHMMPFYSYDVPHTCGPDPKVCCQFDFRRLPGSGVTCPWRVAPQPINNLNVDSRAKMLLDQYRKKAQLYRTNVLLVPLGDDFRYEHADEWDKQFTNYQKLFDHMNSHPDLHVQAQFGTLSDYFRALREESQSSTSDDVGLFPSLSGDFFTYADRDDHYWSGYYTSRPFYKNLDRVLEGYLRGAEILYSLMLATQSSLEAQQPQLTNQLMKQLVEARRNLGLFQHHDGITGTSKDHVVIDYAKKLLVSIQQCQNVMQQSANYLLTFNQRSYHAEGTKVYYSLDETYEEHYTMPSKQVIELHEGQASHITFYNSLAQARSELVTIRTSSPYIQVRNEHETPVRCQVDPVFEDEGTVSSSQFDVSFVITAPAVSLTTFSVQTVAPDAVDTNLISYAAIRVRNKGGVLPSTPAVFTDVAFASEENGDMVLKNSNIEAILNTNGFIKTIKYVKGGKSQKLDIEFVKYGVKNHRETSGAYLFLPDKDAVPIDMSNTLLKVIRGPLLSRAIVIIQNVAHNLLVKNSPGVDGMGLDIVNIVDITKERNYELAMRFYTDVQNKDVFYSDLNGFQVTKRVTYKKLPLQANYYPMPSQMFIEDDHTRISILSKQPLGCASLRSGELEVMLDRRLNQDDNRGVGQGVLDNLRTPNIFRLLVEEKLINKESHTSRDGQAAFPSLLAHGAVHSLLNPIYTLIQKVPSPGRQSWLLGGVLPCDVHLVNLRTMQNEPTPAAKISAASNAALTLHRVGFDCGFAAPGLNCSTNGGKVRLEDLFTAYYSDRVFQMSLSLMYEGVEMTKSYTLSLQPMELYAFKLQRL